MRENPAKLPVAKKIELIQSATAGSVQHRESFEDQYLVACAPFSPADAEVPMPTVLIIDDDHATRTALEILLKQKKFGVFVAPDGLTGIRLISSMTFDAVVIDMFMPGMDGLATIRELIKIDPSVPFIAISGYAFTDRRQGAPDFLGMAIKLGATSALQKPFDILDLLDAVNGAIEVRQRLLRENESPDIVAAPARKAS